jgi:hypothetical protein
MLQTALGATVLIIGSRKRRGEQFSLVLRRSKLLRREGFKKAYVNEMLVYVNDVGNVLAVVPENSRLDIVAQIEREEALEEVGAAYGWSAVSLITRSQLSNPLAVKRSVLQFI